VFFKGFFEFGENVKVTAIRFLPTSLPDHGTFEKDGEVT
jgi:hypothetical protein